MTLIRQGISLSLAVNLAAIPMTLYYFGMFPLLGILFNLFFPFLISLSMLLLLIGLALIPLQIGYFVNSFNDLYTQIILNFTSFTPRVFDFYLTTPLLPSWLILIYISLYLGISIVWKNNLNTQMKDEMDWSYI
jgi:competence protein ComEC